MGAAISGLIHLHRESERITFKEVKNFERESEITLAAMERLQSEHDKKLDDHLQAEASQLFWSQMGTYLWRAALIAALLHAGTRQKALALLAAGTGALKITSDIGQARAQQRLITIQNDLSINALELTEAQRDQRQLASRMSSLFEGMQKIQTFVHHQIERVYE